jgi:hypothetical protein
MASKDYFEKWQSRGKNFLKFSRPWRRVCIYCQSFLCILKIASEETEGTTTKNNMVNIHKSPLCYFVWSQSPTHALFDTLNLETHGLMPQLCELIFFSMQYPGN